MLNVTHTKHCFIFIEWTLFFGLCGLSAVFMKEVLEKFYTEKTSFTKSEEPITEFPTISLCFSKSYTMKNGATGYNRTYEYGPDFKIRFSLIKELQYSQLRYRSFLKVKTLSPKD